MNLGFNSYKPNIILVCKGCHNEIPQTDDDLNNRNLFSHSSGGWNSKTKVKAGLVCGEVSFAGCLLNGTSQSIGSLMLLSLLIWTPVILD